MVSAKNERKQQKETITTSMAGTAHHILISKP